MIVINRVAPEEMIRRHREAAAMQSVRSADSRSEPAPVNLSAALELGEARPLLWDGTTFVIPPISYRAGLRLTRIQLELRRYQQHPAQSAEEIDAFAALVQTALELFYELLGDARPPTNPFADARPREVGELLGFFLMYLMGSSAAHPSRMGRHRPST